MAGSLRKLKRGKPKVKVGIKRRQHKRPGCRTKAPLELGAQRSALLDKMGERPDWAQGASTLANYAANKLVSDPNAGFGRNEGSADAVQAAAADFEGDADAQAPADDDFRSQILGQVRSTGPAPPARLTATQTLVIRQLLDAHGQDIHAMSRDAKLNRMLLTEGQLKRMLCSYQAQQDGSTTRYSFTAPRKRLM